MGDKVSYWVMTSEPSAEQTAYLEDDPLPDGSFVGAEKHTDLTVHVRWDGERWVEACHREWELVDLYAETYRESGQRPPCACDDVIPR